MRQLWAIITRLSIFVPSPIGGGAVGAAVDRSAGADLDVGAEFDVAQLGGKLVAAVDQLVAEAIGPQDRGGVDQAARADHGVFIEHGVGENGHPLADPRPAMMWTPEWMVEPRRSHLVADGGQRIDVDVGGHFGRGADAGQRTDADSGRWRPGMEEGHHQGEGAVGVVDQDGGQSRGAEPRAARSRPWPGRRRGSDSAPPIDEGNLARLGIAQRGRPFDHQVAAAEQLALD